MKTRLMMIGLGLMLIGGGYAFAQEGQNAMMKDQGMMTKESKAVEVGNKICPVSGDPVSAPGEKGAMGEAVKYEYNGKIYNLCCPMCIKDFKKDPEKYSKIADDEVNKAKK